MNFIKSLLLVVCSSIDEHTDVMENFFEQTEVDGVQTIQLIPEYLFFLSWFQVFYCVFLNI
jgi:hypothetical protein